VCHDVPAGSATYATMAIAQRQREATLGPEMVDPRRHWNGALPTRSAR
jgi:hypothetical protein